MKRKIKKAISIILILALLPSVTQLNVKGQVQNVENTIQINEKPFFEYIEGKPGDLHLVYTYIKDNKTYKVVEDSTEDFKTVNSTIYVKNNENEFIVYSTLNTIVENNVASINQNKDGLMTTNKIGTNQNNSVNDLSMSSKVPDQINLQQELQSNILSPMSVSTVPFNKDSIYGLPLTDWIDDGFTYGSGTLDAITISTVITLIGLAACSAIPNPITPYAIVVAEGFTASLIAMNVSTLYWRTHGYYKRCVSNNMVVAGRSIVDYYSNREMSTYVKTISWDNYNPDCYIAAEYMQSVANADSLCLEILDKNGNSGDVQEIMNWLAAGMTLQQARDTVVDSAAGLRAWVLKCYRLLLNREPSEAEISGWVNSGLRERRLVVNGFMMSDEFASGHPGVEQTQRLANVYSQYMEVLDKCGNEGCEYWASLMDNGMPLQDLHDTLVNHPDGLRAWVLKCYRLLLNREPSESEIAGWVNSGIVERRLVVGGFMMSDEYYFLHR